MQTRHPSPCERGHRICARLLCIGVALVGLLATGEAAAAVNIPLTVREHDGLARHDNPVNSGVPLPQGAVMRTDELRLLDADGAVVLASIEARARWLDDDSLRWVTVHFLVPELAAHGRRDYRLVSSSAAAPASPLNVDFGSDGRSVVVVTGPGKFVIDMQGLAPFRQVFLRSDPAEDFTAEHALLARPGRVQLVARNGRARLVARPDRPGEFRSAVAELDDQAYTQTVRIHEVEIEERGPARAVVALHGSFSTPAQESLDVTARLYCYAGSALAQMTLSVRNRNDDDWAAFVGIDELSVRLPMRTADEIDVRFAADGGSTPAGALPARLAQTASDRYTLHVGDAEPRQGARSDGWLQTSTAHGSLIAGTRWFWQNDPSGLAVDADGAASVQLKAVDGERVDLFTGGAKTRFLFFHFGRDAAAEPAAIAAGSNRPLIAACAPDWMCQGTRVFGDLYSSTPELYAERYRDLVGRYQERVDACIRRIRDKRPRPRLDFDEYGWLDFGSGLHASSTMRESAAESWWDGNYYDFPHAAIVNYLRTGDPINLITAEEAGLHLADLDICHSFPGRPAWAGAPRSGPVVGHFRNYTRGQSYTGHASFTFYKNESLYELYYLTGERWYRDIALLSSRFGMRRWGGGALRNLAHGVWGVLSAYRHTHERKYLDRARAFIAEWGKAQQDGNDGSFADQHWMYGLAFEAYQKYYQLSGDEDTARYLVRAVDALIAEFWKPDGGTGGLNGISLYGYGLAYEYTGQQHYFDKGLLLLERLAQPGSAGDRVKTFAQNYRGSPYFLKYLTADFTPQPILEQAE